MYGDAFHAINATSHIHAMYILCACHAHAIHLTYIISAIHAQHLIHDIYGIHGIRDATNTWHTPHTWHTGHTWHTWHAWHGIQGFVKAVFPSQNRMHILQLMYPNIVSLCLAGASYGGSLSDIWGCRKNCIPNGVVCFAKVME